MPSYSLFIVEIVVSVLLSLIPPDCQVFVEKNIYIYHIVYIFSFF